MIDLSVIAFSNHLLCWMMQTQKPDPDIGTRSWFEDKKLFSNFVGNLCKFFDPGLKVFMKATLVMGKLKLA